MTLKDEFDGIQSLHMAGYIMEPLSNATSIIQIPNSNYISGRLKNLLYYCKSISFDLVDNVGFGNKTCCSCTNRR